MQDTLRKCRRRSQKSWTIVSMRTLLSEGSRINLPLTKNLGENCAEKNNSIQIFQNKMR